MIWLAPHPWYKSWLRRVAPVSDSLGAADLQPIRASINQQSRTDAGWLFGVLAQWPRASTD
jgi:hypothetical protein